jgi:hypothetical protein
VIGRKGRQLWSSQHPIGQGRKHKLASEKERRLEIRIFFLKQFVALLMETSTGNLANITPSGVSTFSFRASTTA